MAKPPPEPLKLPPQTVAACWWTFVKWVVGLPLAVAGALGIVWFAFWAYPNGGTSTQLEGDTATVLFWLAAIALMYPLMLFVWVSDLRKGLKLAREWEAMPPEARAAAIAEADAAALAAKPKRRTRKKKG